VLDNKMPVVGLSWVVTGVDAGGNWYKQRSGSGTFIVAALIGV